jgi:catechol 2,3-dioxygenase-like lactoylglutathione lyase family enzyme
MSPSSDTLALLTPARQAYAIAGISHVAIAVADPARARDFYCGLLGFTERSGISLPHCGDHRLLQARSGQHLALCRAAPGPSLATAANHIAYRMSGPARAAALEVLRRRGTEIFTYREYRPAEGEQNCYLHDPDGNRIQLVADRGLTGEGVAAIDHAALEAIDLEWAEKFYVGTLGLAVDHVVGWRTEDYVRAEAWAAGKEDMAPGACRLDKRYFAFPGQPTHRPRPNVQLYVRAGAETLALYLTTEHRQEPPEEQLIGTPRIGLRVAGGTLEQVASELAAVKRPCAGPVVHDAASPVRRSLYLKDPGANFLELCAD